MCRGLLVEEELLRLFAVADEGFDVLGEDEVAAELFRDLAVTKIDRDGSFPYHTESPADADSVPLQLAPVFAPLRERRREALRVVDAEQQIETVVMVTSRGAQHIAAVYTVGDVGQWLCAACCFACAFVKSGFTASCARPSYSTARGRRAAEAPRSPRLPRHIYRARAAGAARPSVRRTGQRRTPQAAWRARARRDRRRRILPGSAEAARADSADTTDRRPERAASARLPERAYRVQLRLIQDLVASPAGGRAAAAGGDAAAGELFTQLLKDETHIARV